MRILGISAFYHDSAAALVGDGVLLAAAQEERFTRKKHDSNFPINAIRYALKAAGLTPADLDAVAFYDKPFLKFERLLETYLAFAPKGFTSFRKGFPLWVKEKLFQKRELCEELALLDDSVDWSKKLLFSEHHLSHAASAFYPSPFESSAVLTMDGVGEWTTTSLALDEINLPRNDEFGTQKVITFLRQMVQQGGFWRTEDREWVAIDRIQFVGACNPPTDPGRVVLSSTAFNSKSSLT